jgi:hypothetical protein
MLIFAGAFSMCPVYPAYALLVWKPGILAKAGLACRKGEGLFGDQRSKI